MSPQTLIPVSELSSVEDQIRYLDDFLRELDPDQVDLDDLDDVLNDVEDAPNSDRISDLRRAQRLIDDAIELIRPHLPGLR